MSTKLRKNLKLKSVSPNLYDATYISSFFGITLNALYLRMHFENFPKATKINGKLYFDFNEILSHFKKDDENEAYTFLVKDEIRTLIDTGRINRYDIGKILGSKNPSVSGGAVYLRSISIDRANILKSGLIKLGFKLELETTSSFVEQKNERLSYIYPVWEDVSKLIEMNKISKYDIGSMISNKNQGYIGKSIVENGPSYKVAKILKLKLLQQSLI